MSVEEEQSLLQVEQEQGLELEEETIDQQEAPVQASVEEKKSLLQMEQELTQETSQESILEDQEYVDTTETEISEKEEEKVRPLRIAKYWKAG